jgi:glycosyltransferase involved in cell wall biosynthesis
MTNAARQKGVLFIHLVAAHNGAAMTLLHFLRWLSRNGRRPFSVLLCDGGKLVTNFTAVAKTEIASNSCWGPRALRTRGTRAIGLGRVARAFERAVLRRSIAEYGPGLVYLNGFSSENFRLIEVLDLGVPILTHVHELGLLLRTQAGSALPRMLSRSDRFIACSEAVRQNLMCEHGIESARIEVVHSSIPVSGVHAQRSREEVLRELNFPSDSLVVIGCGAGSWNKGTDIFVLLAQSVCKQQERARFVWVGDVSALTIMQYELDVAKRGLAGKLRFTGLVANPADYISAADVFVLPSREDSFPLVCLEAAALAKPIICFADAGGIPEFVENDAGFVVPYLDVETMAGRLVALLDSSERRSALGATARGKVTSRHDISRAAPRIAQIIDAMIADA